MHTTKRFIATALLVVSAVGIAGCWAGTTDRCKCPNLEDVVMSIDWLSNGTASSELQSSDSTLDPPYSLFVMVELADVQDGPRAQATIAQRMIDAGFAVVDDSGGKWVFEDAEWLVSVLLASDPTGGDDPFPLIWVQIVDADERAAEILAPITDALGTLS